MKKNHNCAHFSHLCVHAFRVMKLTIFILLLGIGNIFASNSYAQNTRLSLHLENSTVGQVFDRIQQQSEFIIFYKDNQIDINRKVNVNTENSSVDKILNQVLSGTNLTYHIFDRQIVIGPRDEMKSRIGSEEKQSPQPETKTITGKVNDVKGKPIPGVTIIIKGTTQGTITDADGNFSIANVPVGSTLSFSFVGMKTIDMAPNGKTSLDVVMDEETVGLDEVVAVGYGVQKKVDVTGALSTVEGGNIANKPVAQVSNALQGVAPGITVTQSSGQPGADAGTIHIRGVGTVNTDNSIPDKNAPLVLVDGMEYNINDVDPNDIASISVLKDAAASSIYGVRAANGVILITTKRGKDNQIKVSYNGYVGVQKPTKLPNFVGAQDYMKLVNQLSLNSGGSAKFTDADIAAYNDPNRNKDQYPDVYWMDEILQGSGIQQQHSIAISGGSDKAKFRFSTNYLNQKGLVKKANFERVTVRLNSDVTISDKLKFNADVSGNFSNRSEPQGNTGNTGDGIWFQFSQAIMSNPTLPVKYSDGTWGVARGDGNPVRLQSDGGSYKYNDDVFSGNFRLSYEILKGLELSGNAMVNYDVTNNTYNDKALSYINFFTKNEMVKGSNQISKKNYGDFYYNLQSLLRYNVSLGKNNLGLLGGISKIDDKTNYLYGYRNNGSLNVLSELAGGDPASQKNNGYSYGYGLLSYFGRVNYSYNDKYLFEANIRRDGSSRFSKENRWGTFPSFSAGWQLLKEPFMDGINFMSELKLRASWGQLGNQELGNYPYQSVMVLGYDYPFGGSLNPGARIETAANSNISWETTEMSDIGLDAMFMKGKMNLSFDYYVKNTNDILLQLPIPKTVGQNAPYQNAGSVQNKGWEFSLGYKGAIQQKFKYNVQFNISDVKNKITDLKNADWERSNNDNVLRAYHVGEPIGAFYGYICDGIFQSQAQIDNHATQPGNVAPGDLIYRDLNHDGKIDASDRTVIGSDIPRYTYGLNINATYKNFDLSAFFQGVGKVDVTTVQSNRAPISQDGNFKKLHLDSWTPDNTSASFPRLTSYSHNYVSSSFWIKNGAYLRLKNLQIGYSLPKSFDRTVGIDRCRFYVSGQNLVTWSKLNKYGIDPENPDDSRYYPQVKVFSLGVNVDF